MDDLGRALDCEARPFLHSCSIDVLLCMLEESKPQGHRTTNQPLTSKVIQEIGSSSGIGVLLIIFNDKVSSSNSKVKMAPGGVHVPTIR